jgi:crotonobetainyl-CoA:carnitine CoA-transferase CaiB-like acyl-CoA transferase
LTERGFFFEQEHPVAGRVKMPGVVPITPFMDRMPDRPAPLLGQHNTEIYEELGLSPNDIKSLAGAGII